MSDRNARENFTPVNSETVLAKVAILGYFDVEFDNKRFRVFAGGSQCCQTQRRTVMNAAAPMTASATAEGSGAGLMAMPSGEPTPVISDELTVAPEVVQSGWKFVVAAMQTANLTS